MAATTDRTEIERIRCECGCELRDTDGTLADIAASVLECADPPRGDDLDLCRRIAGSRAPQVLDDVEA